jgi:hypothetical protein
VVRPYHREEEEVQEDHRQSRDAAVVVEQAVVKAFSRSRFDCDSCEASCEDNRELMEQLC